MVVNRTIGQPTAPLLRRAPILVGRAREQGFLREALATAIGGSGRLVLLGGEAGIGKTALARDLASQLAMTRREIDAHAAPVVAIGPEGAREATVARPRMTPDPGQVRLLDPA